MGSVYGNGSLGLADFLDGTLVIIGDGALDEVRIATGVGLGGGGDVIQIHGPCDAGPGAASALDGDIADGLRIFGRNRNRAVITIFRGIKERTIPGKRFRIFDHFGDTERHAAATGGGADGDAAIAAV